MKVRNTAVMVVSALRVSEMGLAPPPKAAPFQPNKVLLKLGVAVRVTVLPVG
jgi:hypothetical protein